MLYKVPVLTGSAAELAGKAKIGIDTQMFVSLSPFEEVGRIEQTEVGAQIELAGCSYDSADTTVTHDSEAGLAVSDVVTGTGIPDGTTVLTKTSATEFELSANTTAAVVSGGTLLVDKAGAATLTLSGTYETPATGADLQLVLITGVPNVTSVTRLRFAVVDSSAGSVSAAAKVKPPAYADQRPNAGKNIGVELLGPDSAKNIRSVTSLTSIVGGAVGAIYAIYKLPDTDSWRAIDGAVKKDITPGSPGAVPIWDGYEVSVVKEGRGSMPTLSVSAKHSTFANGLARYNGDRISMMFVTRDNRTQVVSREVCGDVFLDFSLPRGEANDEQIISASSAFSKLAIFV